MSSYSYILAKTLTPYAPKAAKKAVDIKRIEDPKLDAANNDANKSPEETETGENSVQAIELSLMSLSSIDLGSVYRRDSTYRRFSISADLKLDADDLESNLFFNSRKMA